MVKEDNANKGEIKILKNGLLESEEPEEDKEELDKIRHNIITRYLHENIVVELFMHAVKKAQQGTRDNRTDLFIENCGFLQTVEFDLKYIYDNTEISKTINISTNTISKIARFVDQCLSNIDSQGNIDDYYRKEIEMFLHQMFFKKMCGRNLTDIAIKTDIKRKDELKEYFKLENENPDNNNNIFLNNDNDNDEIKTNISGDDQIENYKNYLYTMPNDADVVNELYELAKDDFLKRKHRQEEENKKYEWIRELKKKKLTKLKELEENIDVKKINATLCALISNPNFIQTIANNTSELISNTQNISSEDMEVFMEILNFVDLPLKNDRNSKGILDIAGWFNPRMYNNLKYLHQQLLNYKNPNFQMYCARHLDKIIDYEIEFEERAELREKIAVVLFVVAVILYCLISFGLITSISFPFAIGIYFTTGVGLGVLAYNYFKSKIIKKAMQLFGLPEWYRLKYDNRFISVFTTPNEELAQQCSPQEKQMYNLVESIFSLRKKLRLASHITITTEMLNKQNELVEMAVEKSTSTQQDKYRLDIISDESDEAVR